MHIMRILAEKRIATICAVNPTGTFIMNLRMMKTIPRNKVITDEMKPIHVISFNGIAEWLITISKYNRTRLRVEYPDLPFFRGWCSTSTVDTEEVYHPRISSMKIMALFW